MKNINFKMWQYFLDDMKNGFKIFIEFLKILIISGELICQKILSSIKNFQKLFYLAYLCF
jgi:hypothetical protein